MKRLHSAQRPRTRGFALVVTLLMTFLMVSLLMALMSLTLVENRVISNQIKMSRARGYAMQGVQVALFRLHDIGGVDQRITATAALLDTDPTSPEPDGVANPWLTGIWKGRNMTDAQRKKPITWLTSGAEIDWDQLKDERDVSNNTNSNSSSSSASKSTPKKEPVTHTTQLDDPSPTSDTVWLLRKPVGEDAKLSVKARKVDIQRIRPFRSAEPDKPYLIGHYAWWAADEGVKARANLTLPEADPDQPAPVDSASTLAQWRLAAPQHAVWEMDGLTSLPKDQKKLHKVLSFAQIPLLGGANSVESGLQKRWHDLTADSLGLIVNTRTGGIKHDLSLFCEMDPDDREKYSPGLNSTFASLIDFYEAHRRVQNASATPVLDAQAFARSPGTSTSKSSLAAAANNYLDNVSHGGHENPGKALFSPMVIRSGFAFSVQAESAPPTELEGPDRKLVLVVDPVVTLWNPYNVTLQLDAYGIQSWLPTMHIVIEKRDPWKSLRVYKPGDEVWHNGALYISKIGSINTAPGGGENPPAWEQADRDWSLATDSTLAEVQGNQASSMPRLVLLQSKNDAGSRLSLKPGQIITFSLNNAAPVPANSADFALDPGWNASGGVSYDKIASSRFVLPTGGGPPDRLVRVYANEEVRITLEPGRDAGYAGADPFGFVARYQAKGLQAADPTNSPAQWRESIGYRNGGGTAYADYHWAGVRAGHGPEFTHRVRAYTGLYNGSQPLPGMSDVQTIDGTITAGAKQFLGSIEWRMKTDVSTESFPALTSGRFDPRAIVMQHPGRGYPSTVPQWQIEARRAGGDVWNSALPLTDVTPVIAFEVPTAPLISVGQLQHFPIQAFARHRPSATAYAIGNAWSSPWVPLDQETAAGNGFDGEDVSRVWNRTFFDDYFFSSIARRPGDELVNGRLADFLDSKLSKPLPNPRMKFFLAGGERRSSLYSRLTAPLDPDNNPAPAFKRVAASLFCEGAFNVHSTSVEAWKALLSSLSESDVPVNDPDGGVSTQKAPGAKFPRHALSNSAANDNTSSTRRLSTSQIDSLAREIVAEVKKRAPFVGLSDFINRRFTLPDGSNDDSIRKTGTLQAAIDRTNINAAAVDPQLTRQQLDATAALGQAEGMDWSFPYPDNATGHVATAVPGYLTQADVLQWLAPHLTTRSDTFKIRSYGDVINPASGRLEARAWVEVIVQRIPPFVNYPNRDAEGKVIEPIVIDPAWQQPETLHNTSNHVLGRTWRVVRVRWLSPEEV